MSFTNLGLSKSLLHAIDKQGYTTPSPIQLKAIPQILAGKDVLASAQTGTGKTAGFTLPMLHLLSEGPQPKRRPIRGLVLTPTRELAAQVFENVKSYSEFLHLESAVIFGGVNQNPQVRILKNGVDVLVATPGRLLDLHNQKLVHLDQVEFLVLDEADRMLDMGFARDINKILAFLPAKRQNLLFSATFSREIKDLAKKFMHNPILVEATPENTTVEKIIQKTYRVNASDKTEILINMIYEGIWQQALVFTRTKHGANRLAEKLNKADITAAAIHGNKSQGARTKALAGFKEGKVRVLVATDIAARGLDIPLLPHVVNYELPNVPEDYIHRIGRTGRAGASGVAISLVAHDELEYVREIEKLLGEKLSSEVVEGFEPSATPPKKEKSTSNRGNSSRSTPKSGGGNWKDRKRPNKSNSGQNKRNDSRFSRN